MFWVLNGLNNTKITLCLMAGSVLELSVPVFLRSIGSFP